MHRHSRPDYRDASIVWTIVTALIGSPAAASSPKQTANNTAKRTGRRDVPLKIAVVNCRSIVSKQAEVLNLVEGTRTDIIIGTESWLTKDIKDSEICPVGYNIFRKDRLNGKGGGVFIMVSNEYVSSKPDIQVPPEVEMTWAQVQVVGSKILKICSFYRPPNSNDNSYLEALNTSLSQIPENHQIWVAGDFNLGDIDWTTSSPSAKGQHVNTATQLISIADDHGLTQMVDKPTRLTETTANTLDLFFTNCPSMVNRCEVIPGISDHDIPLLDVSTRIVLNKTAPRKVYQYHKANFDNIDKSITEFSRTFYNKYADKDSWDINVMWSEFKASVIETMDAHIPVKYINSRKQGVPWVTQKVKKEIRKRNNMFKKAKKSNDPTAKQDYLKQRAKTQSMIRKSYWTHLENSITGGDTPADKKVNKQETQKRFWSHIKAMKKDRVGTAPLKENGLLVSDSKAKAGILNRQYESVFSREDSSNIPAPSDPPSPPMPEIEISRNGILKQLQDLKVDKASGPDLIPPKILKAAANPISFCLERIFQASLSTGTVPDDWKQANITPVFKKGERFKASNYRPVSLTCICSKLLEHIVVSNLMAHFDKHDILVDCQHGFRSKRSCETQLLGLVQELHQNLEDKEQVDMVVLDFSKAFDKVPHKRLMTKLWNYGVKGNTHGWIESFLMNRTQRVVVDGESSDWADVKSGVPQGTVLGPVLFLAYINDLPSSVQAHTRLFADDCVMYRSVKSNEDHASLQQDLRNLELWEQKWCMTFNADKCSTITITRKKKPLNFSYELHSQILERVDSATYLGVELSSDLTWARHIDKTTAKANRQLAFIRRNLPIRNTTVKSAAYIGLVRPILEYCAPVWNPHHKKYISQIEMVQRRAARFVCSRYHNTSSVTEMLGKLQWESLEHRRIRAGLMVFYKIQFSLVAIPLPAIVVRPEKPRPGYPHQYRIPYCNTESYKNSYFPRIIRQWNSLPATIACQGSLPLFKTALSSHSF
jgi:hypothetical protein